MKPTTLCRTAMLFVPLAFLTAGEADANRPREHDGFFLRLSGGIGGAGTEIEADFGTVQSEADFSGMSGDVNLAIGGVISSNLALHGTLTGWTISDPDIEVNGIEVEVDDYSLWMSMVGGGLTYYFMPSNVYISGSIGAATLDFNIDGDDEDSDTGVAMEFAAGKEWWVGNRWGLGVAGHIGFHSIPSDEVDGNYTGQSYGVRFSATFN